MLLNIIHPYTYKLARNRLSIGPCEEFTERDERIRDLVMTALESGVTVLWHKYHDGQQLRPILHDIALQADPLYEFLFDPRVESVVTTPYGIPLPDEKPAGISQKEWRLAQKIYTSHSHLARKIGNPSTVLFIGGTLENCIANAALYFHLHYRVEGQDIFYIPKLSVSLNPGLWGTVQPRLDAAKIKPLESEEALDLIRKRDQSSLEIAAGV